MHSAPGQDTTHAGIEPNTGAVNRALLAQLACEPDTHVRAAHPAWADPARRATAQIRERLAVVDDFAGVDIDELRRWRTSLDQALSLMHQRDPAQFRHWRQPGTWLDSLLRLRALLEHVSAQAYDAPTVAYADMDVPGYLWGSR